jgi:hypothetical protein
LFFCPDGTILICNLNLPKSIHDSKDAVIGRIYSKLDSVYRRNGGKCTAISASAANNVNYIIPLLATVEIEAKDRIAFCNRIFINKEARAMQQSAVWGMHEMKACFPRRFNYEEYF